MLTSETEDQQSGDNVDLARLLALCATSTPRIWLSEVLLSCGVVGDAFELLHTVSGGGNASGSET